MRKPKPKPKKKLKKQLPVRELDLAAALAIHSLIRLKQREATK